MRAILYALMLFLTLLSGCASLHHNEAQAVFNPLQCQPIPGNGDHQRLCVMLTRNRGDLWFVVGDSAYAATDHVAGLSFMGGGNEAASFGDFSISPGGSYLAVTIAEEGHPTLSIAHLQDFLQGKEVSDNLTPIAVYPGTVTIERWLHDNLIVISSDQDLINYRHGDELGEVHEYLLHLPDGAIKAI